MKEVVLTSEWLNQDRSRDPMKGRVVLLKELNPDGSVFQFVLTEQWEQSDKPNWENPKRPAYGHGEYYSLDQEITDEILFDFYKRSANLLKHYLPKRNLTGELMDVLKSQIDLEKVEKSEYKRKKLESKLFEGFYKVTQNLL